MSVLRFPRLYFRGMISWDPGVSNNDSDVYDAVNAEIVLPDGVTYESFKSWRIANPGGNWNYYGTHTCAFLRDRTVITGGETAPGNGPQTDDPLIGKPVALTGKLVDLDPAAVWNSQIFFNGFSAGDAQARIAARRPHRMHSRWINFRRNIGRPLPIAGNAAVVWQSAFPRESLTLTGTTGSPLLSALREAIEGEDAQGLMIRFCTYQTRYFQNGILNDIPHQPRSIDELGVLYQQGHIFSNPAYSQVAGVIGVWSRGEMASAPEGRCLFPTGSLPLGPCAVAIDRSRRLVSLDLGSTIPEVDGTPEKADFGPLTVAVRSGDAVTPLATIDAAAYGRAAYEARAGILDLALPEPGADGDPLDLLAAGDLLLLADGDGAPVEALREAEFWAQADDRDVYLDQGQSAEVVVSVRRRGEPAPAGTRLLIVRYDRDGQIPAASMRPPEVRETPEGGAVSLHLSADGPGFVNIGLFPFAADAPEPPVPPALDILAGFFVCTRVLPFDDDLEAQTPDDRLTWPFVYANILRVYDLLNPVMASPDIGLALYDEAALTALAERIKQVTAADNFESFSYMPVTRALSAGKRRLLHRWADRVLAGLAAPSGGDAAAEPAAAAPQSPRSLFPKTG